MSKLPSFPHQIKYGGAIVRIIRDPLTVPHVKSPASPESAKAKRKKTAKKTYDSFLVEYYVGAKRKRVRRSTYAKALSAANEVGVKLLNSDIESLQLSGKDRRVYLAALDNLKGIEKPLDHVTKEYADAIRMLPAGVSIITAMAQYSEAIARANGTPLSSVLEFFERHGMDIKAKKTVSEVIAELLPSVKADGAGNYHIRDLKRRLGRFSESFSGNILDVTHSQLVKWLQQLKKLPGPRKRVGGELVPVGPKHETITGMPLFSCSTLPASKAIFRATALLPLTTLKLRRRFAVTTRSSRRNRWRNCLSTRLLILCQAWRSRHSVECEPRKLQRSTGGTSISIRIASYYPLKFRNLASAG